MARARNIKPSLFKNELLGAADPLLTLLFQSLWTLADKEGRLEDRPLRIKAETFPYRDGLDINGYLTDLQRLGFIVRYSVDGLELIQVVNFKKHQTPHNTEKPSVLPPVEAGNLAGCALQGASVKSPLSTGENVEALPPDSLNLIPDSLNLIPDKKTTAAKPPPFNPKTYLASIGVSETTADDWLTLRKAKRAAVTKTALAGIEREAGRAGLTIQAVLELCCQRGWQGFEASWVNCKDRGTIHDKRAATIAELTGQTGRTIEGAADG